MPANCSTGPKATTASELLDSTLHNAETEPGSLASRKPAPVKPTVKRKEKKNQFSASSCKACG